MKKINEKTNKQHARAALTREKMLEVAIEAFATRGYEGIGTRELADRAGVNLSAIRYHFGDKAGLYHAAIQHISEGIRERVMSPFVLEIRSRLEKKGVSREDLIDSLCELVTRFASHLLGPGIGNNWSRLVIREMTNPTDSFEAIYNVQRLVIDTVALIIGKIRGQAPESQEVRIRTVSLLGQVVVFRTAPATTLRAIGWKQLGQREISALQLILREHCRALMNIGGE
jgi:TetR/AcrR family transcriptional regulator, regulator of cefoperazone and chloramphenicol sensitivity